MTKNLYLFNWKSPKFIYSVIKNGNGRPVETEGSEKQGVFKLLRDSATLLSLLQVRLLNKTPSFR